MTIKHLTDDEVQQYVLDGVSAGKETAAHVHNCQECSARVETYRLLITGVKQQAAPIFDFNLHELVLSRLPSRVPKPATDPSLAWVFILASVVFTGVAIYFFRNYLADLFAGITSLLFYLAVISTFIVSIALCIDMYKTWQKKMKSLDLN